MKISLGETFLSIKRKENSIWLSFPMFCYLKKKESNVEKEKVC